MFCVKKKNYIHVVHKYVYSKLILYMYVQKYETIKKI